VCVIETRLTLDIQILLALGLDLLLGDPRWLPHPVKGIGWLARQMERVSRRTFRQPFLAGAATLIVVVGTSAGLAFVLVILAGRIDLLFKDLVSTLLIYTTIAAHDLAAHSNRVRAALDAGDMDAARRGVGMIVGRDTSALDEHGVTRAAVESIAESTLDGITAPLFYAALLGPVGAIVYRAANTLDSLFGHRDERYMEFGRASARLDDLLNYVPARLTVPLVALAAAILRMRPLRALAVCRRDGRKHASPNAGLCEAAFAGALGVQLGGTSFYGGVPHEGHPIGDPVRLLDKRQIARANRLMLLTAALAVLALLGFRRLWILGISR
jgi:adenosylcobinamide-phosphate synthase